VPASQPANSNSLERLRARIGELSDRDDFLKNTSRPHEGERPGLLAPDGEMYAYIVQHAFGGKDPGREACSKGMTNGLLTGPSKEKVYSARWNNVQEMNEGLKIADRDVEFVVRRAIWSRMALSAGVDRWEKD